jgi:hypothetical protein
MKTTAHALLAATIALATIAAAGTRADAAFTRFDCTVDQVQLHVGANAQRVAVRCTAAAPGGIYWFAYRFGDNPELAKMILSLLTTAKASGRGVIVAYESTDTSGNAWGCQTNDCRTILQVVLR